MTQQRWWESRWFMLAAMLVSAVPLLWPAVPPLIDLPGHIGRYHVAAALAGSPDLQRHWAYDWRLIGNLGIDLLVMPLIPLVGVELATKLVVLAIPPLTVGGLIQVSRAADGRVSPAAAFAFPLAYAFPFQFGFVNFALGAALSFWALALWICWGQHQRLVLRAAIFAPVALLLWVVHCFGWAMFGLFAFGAELVALRRAGRPWLAALWLAGLRCIPLALPLLPMLAGGGSGDGGLGASWEWAAKAGWVASLLRERWGPYDIVSVILLVTLCWAAFRSRPLTTEPAIAAAAGLGILAWAVLPYRMLGGAYVDMRMAPYAVALLLVAIRVRPGAARLAVPLALAGSAFFVLRMATTTIVFAQAAQLQQQAAAIGSAIPRGASVLVAVYFDCRGWGDRRLEHVAGLVLARRDTFDNSQWTLEGQQLLHDRRPDAGLYRADPSQMMYGTGCREHPYDFATTIRTFNRAAFDYVWTIDFPARARLAPDVVQVARSGPSVLYRVVRPSQPR